MRISRVLTGATAVAVTLTLAGVALADNTTDPELVAVDSDGSELSGEFTDGQVSDDGPSGIYNRVLSAENTQRVDVGADAEPADGISRYPSVTQDGSQTLFANDSANWGTEAPIGWHHLRIADS